MEGLMCHCKACGSFYDSRSGECPCQRIAALDKRVKELETVIKALLWPNVPSADDIALMIRMCGTPETQDPAMELVDRLRTAQANARELVG